MTKGFERILNGYVAEHKFDIAETGENVSYNFTWKEKTNGFN